MKKLWLLGVGVVAVLFGGQHLWPLADRLVSVAIGPAQAHSVEKGPMGGRIRHIGKVHVELLVDGASIRVHLYDDDSKPLAAKGHKAIVILQGGNTARVVLEAGEGNSLAGVLPAGTKSNSRAVVQLTKPDGTSGQARFE